ncbi:PorT family protein [Hymenobacter busanensis]|uniref:PorT family protein n=1 Tax=Hymenobacter busanensis TaxID=2607656 RepID=A0A7L5A4S0_9BACT|nr:outer membrane beta-barrel protein [Hymenobacter busanensis]KAA9338326.1 PorT family protein [Hymenobacter busanensis]QHJ09250.1 outer membrane beta-barrel protein [Hymenobacter busanensis]
MPLRIPPFRQLVLLFILISGAAQGQGTFRPGYVVPLAGDTLRGEVDFRGYRYNAQQVEFRQNGTTQQYKPSGLRGYGLFKGPRFESQPVSGVPVFVLQLVRGAVGLYSFTDAQDRVRFYVAAPAAPSLIELLKRDTTVERMVGGQLQRGRVQDTRYRTQLQQILSGCPAVEPLIERVGYTDTELARLITKYNACVTLGAAAAVIPPQKTTTFRVFAGGQQSSLSFGEGRLQGQTFKTGMRPMVGAGILVHPARFGPRLAVGLEAYWTSIDVEKQFEGGASGLYIGYPSQATARYKAQFVRLPISLRYSLGNSKLQPFVQAGVLISTQFQTSSNYHSVSTRPGFPVSETNDPELIDPRTVAYGALGALGLAVPVGGHQLEAEVRYEWVDAISSFTGTNASPHALQLVLGYRFGQHAGQ